MKEQKLFTKGNTHTRRQFFENTGQFLKTVAIVAAIPFVKKLLPLAETFAAQQEKKPRVQNITAEIQPDGSIYLRNYTDEYGNQISISSKDLQEKTLLTLTRKESKEAVRQSDLVAAYTIDGKPVLVFKYGVVTTKEKSRETFEDRWVSPEEIKSSKLYEYPGKDGFGILEINGGKKLVIFYERGNEKFIRPHDANKDP